MLRFSHPDWVAMQTRQAGLEGTGEIRLRELVKQALRVRPSRLIIGEVRAEECLDLLLALNADLDALPLAIMDIEAANGRADVHRRPVCLGQPDGVKTGTGSNASLVGAGVESAARQLRRAGLVTSAMDADEILVLEKPAVPSASGKIQLSTNTDAFLRPTALASG